MKYFNLNIVSLFPKYHKDLIIKYNDNDIVLLQGLSSHSKLFFPVFLHLIVPPICSRLILIL